MRDKNEDNHQIFSLFTGLDKILDAVADMVDQNKEEMNNGHGINSDAQNKTAGNYGVNIKMGMIGTDAFKNSEIFSRFFGDGETAGKTVEPVTDVFEEEDRAIIVSELPGIEKEDITLEVCANHVTLKALKNDICYRKIINLSFEPDIQRIKENLNNSIYSAELPKK